MEGVWKFGTMRIYILSCGLCTENFIGWSWIVGAMRNSYFLKLIIIYIQEF